MIKFHWLNKLFFTRQALKDLDMNASIYFGKGKLFINGNLFNKNTAIHIMENFIDIDNIYDFEPVNLIFNKNNYTYLEKTFNCWWIWVNWQSCIRKIFK